MLVENELKKLKAFDLSYFKGKNYFKGNDGAENTLVFQTLQNTLIYKMEIKLVNGNQKCCLTNLNLNGTIGDVVLSKPIKPMYAIFKGKSILYQHDNDVIAGGPIVNIYTVYKISSKNY